MTSREVRRALSVLNLVWFGIACNTRYEFDPLPIMAAGGSNGGTSGNAGSDLSAGGAAVGGAGATGGASATGGVSTTGGASTTGGVGAGGANVAGAGHVSGDSGAAGSGDSGAPTVGGIGGGSIGNPASNCGRDADCGLASLHCETGSRRCVECLADSQCKAPSGVCDTSVYRCVACLADKDCSADQTCETNTRKCRARCDASNACKQAGYSCDLTRGACRQCDGGETMSDDCPAATMQCQPKSLLCVACVYDNQCPSHQLCDLPAGRCVGCEDSRDCFDVSKPFCNPASQQCVAAP